MKIIRIKKIIIKDYKNFLIYGDDEKSKPINLQIRKMLTLAKFLINVLKSGKLLKDFDGLAFSFSSSWVNLVGLKSGGYTSATFIDEENIKIK